MTNAKALTMGYTVKLQLTCPHCGQYKFFVTPPDPFAVSDFQRVCEVCSSHWDVHLTPQEATFTPAAKPAAVYGFALLVYTGGGLPQYVIVRTAIDPQHHNGSLKAAMEHLHFRYEEHTCPTNFMQVEHVVLNGDNDPHGIYAFVRFVSNQEIKDRYNLTWGQFVGFQFSGAGIEYWAEIFPESQRIGVEEPSTTFR